jgi:hypothetical protein
MEYRVMKRWFLALSALDLWITWQRWLMTYKGFDMSYWWGWVMYHVVSGYPPGALHHWRDDYPEWLKKHEPWLIPFLHTKNKREDLISLREWWGPGWEDKIPWDRLLARAR